MKHLLFSALIVCTFSMQAQLVINEVAPNNAQQYDDEDHTYPDWIEIMNTGAITINLAGYALTDDLDVWNQWLLPSTNLLAGDKVIVFASAKNRDCLGCGGTVTEMHTNFKISYGETVALFDPTGILVDSILISTMQAGHSRARIPDGGVWCYTDNPTPDATNTGTCYSGYASEPSFNTQPGFYTGSVNVTASGSEVRYTTDGDWPGFASTLYTGPISVTNNTVIKITNIEAGKLPSRTVTGSFFIDEPTLLPVVSISSNSCDMFNEGPSCIAAYDGADGWEPDNPQIPAAVEYFTADKVQQFEKRIKFETAGNSSIYVYPQRGMQFTCDEDFGEVSEFDYNIFSLTKPGLDTLNGWRVRANNDWGNSAARMKDVVHNRIALPTHLVVPAYQHAATFINGEYWGHYSAREELDAYFLRNNLGVDPDKVDIIRSGAGEDVWDIAESGTIDAYNDLSAFFNSHNMNNAEHYAEALTLIDKENWVDHFATQIFLNNDEMAYNIRCFKSYEPNMKWKFILWDTGAGGEGETVNSIQSLLSYPYLCDEINMMNDLMVNDEFELYFINRYADLMNYYFTWPRIESIINASKDEIEEEIPAHFARWGTPSVSAFNNGVAELKGFFDNRATYQRNEINSYFGLGGQVNVTLEVEPEGAGYIQISTIIPTTLPWTGIYFDDAPVQVTAIPNPGYSFSHWTDNTFIDDESLIAVLADISANTTFTANFTGAAVVENPIVISEINFNNDSTLNAGDWVELHNISDVDIYLGGYQFGNEVFYNKYTLPQGTMIPADGFLVLAQDTAQFKNIHPDVDNFIGPFVFSLQNEGDSISLTNVIGNVMTAFRFEDKRPWPYTADGFGRTMEFPYYFLDETDPENWEAGCIGGSPGVAFSPCIENPIVEEINYKSSPTEDAGDWFELYNWSGSLMYLSFWSVRDKNGNTFQIPSGTYIPGGGRLVVYQDSLKFFTQHPDVTNAIGPTVFGFDGEGDAIVLYDATGQITFSVGYDDELPYPASADGGGTALQLINASLNINDPDNWTESCPEGSPGEEFVMPCANAIEEPEISYHVIVYPNPSENMFTVMVPELTSTADLVVVDLTGKIIVQQTIQPQTQERIDLSAYPAGMYQLRIDMNGTMQTSILVKL